jgi:hypothetical protein
VRQGEEHGWMQDRADPHAREPATEIARRDPPDGVSPDEAVAAVTDVLDSIGDTCPECPADDGQQARRTFGGLAVTRLPGVSFADRNPGNLR